MYVRLYFLSDICGDSALLLIYWLYMCFIYLSSNVVITLVLKFQSQYFSYGAVSTQIIHDFIQFYFRLFVHYLFRPSVCSVVPSLRLFSCSFMV